jgi:hypothetical protein
LIERKAFGDSAALVAPGALDLAFLSPQVTNVLERGLYARHVDLGTFPVEGERNVSASYQIRETNLRLAEQKAGRYAAAAGGTNGCLLERLEVAFETSLPCEEPFPTRVRHQANVAAAGRQT